MLKPFQDPQLKVYINIDIRYRRQSHTSQTFTESSCKWHHNSQNHYDMVLENTKKFNMADVIGMQNQKILKN